MRILHTADWHLGKKLNQFSRMEEQCAVMDEIIKIANREHVDVVIIAGDLFDNFTPNTESIELFYRTLKRLSPNGIRPIIAISGNHDAPKLIEAPDPLARECGIILIGQPNVQVTPFETEHFKVLRSARGFIELQIEKYNYPLRILHTSYANESRLKQDLGEDKPLGINNLLAKNWELLAHEFCDNKGVNILTAHLFINPKNGEPLEEPEGERPIRIGNADMIYSDAIPSEIQYTALGHLHNFKNIGSKEKPIVYSSSPLCYSFSEAGQEKYVVIVDAQPNKEVTFSKVALHSGKQLIRKTFHTVDNAISWLEKHPNTWLELTIELKEFLKAVDRKKLYNAHSGIVYLIPKLLTEESNKIHNGLTFQDINFQNVIPLFEKYFKYKNNGIAPNKEIINLFKEILSAQ
ncbi:exonuclease subunit SbcD [Capnocytophaga sp. G2]|uniref:metallophosphoesterase family protein n=1 Tax=Capnocytophaga sp. G2 TaxID=3110695 RepID=UPI002B49AB08|nr:exonuclease subunit SbcD [Capnocytophaga sp. G2]MEB3004328.1 exonuclease subunit SbcD [Capnocytophaga sp. G2]